MAKSRIELLIDAKNKTGKAFDKVNKDIKDLEKHASRIKVAGNIFAAFTVGATAGAVAMNALSDSVVESLGKLDDIGKASRRLGLTTDELQEMRVVAKAAGVEISAFDTAFQRFARRAGQARLGTGELVKTFDYLNITLEDNEGNLKSNAELFSEFGEKVADVSDENVQLALTMSGVDTEGVKLIEMFRQTDEEQKKVIKSARELGVIYDDAVIKGAEAYLEQIELVQQAQDRLFTQTEIGASAMILDWERLKLKIFVAGNELLTYVGAQGVARKETAETANEANKLFDQQIAQLQELIKLETDPTRLASLEKRLKYAQDAKIAIDGQLKSTKELNEEAKKAAEAFDELGGVEVLSGVEVGNDNFSKSVDKVLEKLEEERYLLKLSAKEQFIYNQVKKAGAEATYEEINAIKNAAGSLFDKKESLRATKTETNKLSDATKEYKKTADSISTDEGASSTFGKAKKDVEGLTEETEKATKAKKKWLSTTGGEGVDTSDAFEPVNLTPEQASIKALEITTAMQQTFDANPVQVKVNVPTAKKLLGDTISVNSSYSPLTEGGSGLSAVSVARTALKEGTKQ